MVERARAIIRERASFVIQQRDGLSLVEGKQLAVVGFDLHFRTMDGRRSRVCGRKERVLVLRVLGKIERIVLRIDVQDGSGAIRCYRACRRDRRGAGIGRAGVSMFIGDRIGAVLQLRGGRAFAQLVGFVEHFRHALLRVSRRRGSITALTQFRSRSDFGERRIWNLEARQIRDVDRAALGLCCDRRIRKSGCSSRRIDLQHVRFDVRRAALLPAHTCAAGKNDGRSSDRIHVQFFCNRKRVRDRDIFTTDLVRHDGVCRDISCSNNFIRRDVSCCQVPCLILVPNNQLAVSRLLDIAKRPVPNRGRVTINKKIVPLVFRSTMDRALRRLDGGIGTNMRCIRRFGDVADVYHAVEHIIPNLARELRAVRAREIPTIRVHIIKRKCCFRAARRERGFILVFEHTDGRSLTFQGYRTIGICIERAFQLRILVDRHVVDTTISHGDCPVRGTL